MTTDTITNSFVVEVRAQSILEEAAAGFGAGWSLPISVPTLASKTYRDDPVGFPVYPDNAAVWNDSPVYEVSKRAWNWMGKACWDSQERRVVFVNSPAIETDNPQATMLSTYDEYTNVFRIRENPLGYSVGHGFDCNGIDVAARKLYKWTLPFWDATNGWGQPQLGVIDLDTLTLDRIIDRAPDLSSITLDMRTTTAPALDWFPGVGVVMFSKYRLWVCDVATDTWGDEIDLVDLGFTDMATFTFHNVGHYNPDTNRMVFGGGSYSDPGNEVHIASWFRMDSGGSIIQLDDSPVTMSVNSSEADGIRKCAACYVPGTGLSAFFHNDGNIYLLDSEASTGNQWTTLSGAMDSDNATENHRWVAPIDTHNCVMMGHYGVDGASTLKLWRL